MIWRKISKEDIPRFIQFVIQYEWKSVSLSSRIKENESSVMNLIRNNELIYCLFSKKTHQIEGALMVTPTGLLLPLFTDYGTIENHNGLVELKNILKKRLRLYCILGYDSDVIRAQNIFHPIIEKEIEYFLLEAPDSRHDIKGPVPLHTDRIKRACVKDANRLYYLEENYMRDEVLVDKTKFSKPVILQNLKNNCKSQIVIFAEHNNIPIAKANTNAIGIHYAQIGGVFTDYSWRGRGYASLIINRLFYEISKTNRKSILFVKKSNVPANNLYKKLKFKNLGDYRITYVKQ